MGAGADALGVVGGDAAAEALRRIVKRDDELQLVRFSALRSLARLECEVDAEELSTVLEDSVLRPAGLALLGYCDDDASLDWLLKGLESSSRASREAAIEALLGRYSRCEGADADALARRIQEVVRSTDGLVPLCVERNRELTVKSAPKSHAADVDPSPTQRAAPPGTEPAKASWMPYAVGCSMSTPDCTR